MWADFPPQAIEQSSCDCKHCIESRKYESLEPIIKRITNGISHYYKMMNDPHSIMWGTDGNTIVPFHCIGCATPIYDESFYSEPPIEFIKHCTECYNGMNILINDLRNIACNYDRDYSELLEMSRKKYVTGLEYLSIVHARQISNTNKWRIITY